MIYYLVMRQHANTLSAFFGFLEKEFAGRIKVLPYEYLMLQRTLKPGTYIFSDIERLTPGQAEMLSAVWEQMAGMPGSVRMLNHPTRSMHRYELLRTLYEHGQNHFNVYRMTEPKMPERFPVFLRAEDDHEGSLTPLLHTPEDLNKAARKISHLHNKIVIEFCDTSDGDGVFRKYSAYIVGERIIPQHIFFGRNWMLKGVSSVADEASELSEELQYVENNPHEQYLRGIFRLAGINYGRVDYSLFKGKPQIWEINTNPTVMSTADLPKRRKIRELFIREIGSALGSVDRVPKTNVQIPVKFNISTISKIIRRIKLLLPVKK